MTTKAWFGPKRTLGWGWTPVSWEGWAVTGVLVVPVIAGNVIWQGQHVIGPLVALLAAYFCVVLLTGDPPGGPGKRDRGGRR